MAQFKRRADAFSLPRRVSIVVVVSAAFLFLFRGADRLKGRHGLPVRRVDFLFAGRRASFFFSPCLWCTSSTQRGGNVGKKRNGGQHSRARPLAAIPKKIAVAAGYLPFFPRVHALGLRWIKKSFFVLVARTTSPPPVALCIFLRLPFCPVPWTTRRPLFCACTPKRRRKKKKHSASPIYDAHSGLSFPRVAPSAAHHPLAFFSLIAQRCIFPRPSPFF